MLYFKYRAVDGRLDTNLTEENFGCTHTLASDTPWWLVDLDTPHLIAHVTVTSRSDCCRECYSIQQITI